MEMEVLRLGHRLPRDERISTHVALVARAFGAGSIAYSGQHDEGLEKSVQRLAERWGGEFSVSYRPKYKSYIKQRKEAGFTVVHLSMYGIPVPEATKEIRKHGKLLIVVGSEHVPPEVYHLADYNVSVTSQPHSEVAALAIILDRLMEGKELERSFDEKFKGKIRIEPSGKGKDIREADGNAEGSRGCD
ncbi:TPA: tRNA (cytidine(56)-2'-O)-methyltransferase [Candidatus Micrarchaeota archaeon]|nr:tRNA (cytidine(56)-2'-O)-methyltransferase [Candidatus Micrarchaeota archaeon]